MRAPTKRKIKNRSRGIQILLCALLCAAGLLGRPLTAQAGVQTDPANPYTVTMDCPDGVKIWTIYEAIPEGELAPARTYEMSGRKPSYWYRYGETVYFQDVHEESTTLKTGQHFYNEIVNGVVDIAYWKCEWVNGRCIHNSGGLPTPWHGQTFDNGKPVGEKSCKYAYYSGWIAYCAQCGQPVTHSYVYASRDAVSTIDRYDASSPYFYLCPNPDCRNVDNTGEGGHECAKISWNKYRVVYDRNEYVDRVTGDTPPTFHMYDHHTEYEGAPVDPIRTLAESQFFREGYTVTAWNTKPDGTGRSYLPGEEIKVGESLTDENYSEKLGTGTVTLYAVWTPTESTLNVNPNHGSYAGTTAITSIRKGYGENLVLKPGDFTAPDGYLVSFQSNGGSICSPIRQTKHFDSLIRENVADFKGRLNKVGDDYKYS